MAGRKHLHLQEHVLGGMFCIVVVQYFGRLSAVCSSSRWGCLMFCPFVLPGHAFTSNFWHSCCFDLPCSELLPFWSTTVANLCLWPVFNCLLLRCRLLLFSLTFPNSCAPDATLQNILSKWEQLLWSPWLLVRNKSCLNLSICAAGHSVFSKPLLVTSWNVQPPFVSPFGQFWQGLHS